MSLINASHDSLPYVDAEPSTQARANIEKLISAELASEHRTSLHPLIPAGPETHFSDLMQQEIARKAAGALLTGGVDLSRYEAPEPPSEDSGKHPGEYLEAWREVLRKAYTASSHLSARKENLSLLEENGKNAWLLGNAQLEEILRGLEKELVETTEATDAIHKQRKAAQGAHQGEIAGLEETWRRGIGGIIDVELAAESLRMQILQLRRQQAQS